MTILLWTLFGGGPVQAGSRKEIDAAVANGLQEFQNLGPSFAGLYGRAVGILVFPKVNRGLAVGGDLSGEGGLVIGNRVVSYHSIISASAGLTAAATEPRNEIIVFLTQAALDQFRSQRQWYIKSGVHGELGSRVSLHYHREDLAAHTVGFIVSAAFLTESDTLRGSQITSIPIASLR